jgi:hypothetical protein
MYAPSPFWPMQHQQPDLLPGSYLATAEFKDLPFSAT